MIETTDEQRKKKAKEQLRVFFIATTREPSPVGVLAATWNREMARALDRIVPIRTALVCRSLWFTEDFRELKRGTLCITGR